MARLPGESEDDLLRTAALQNATAILQARVKAERALLSAREALEKQSQWLEITLSSIAEGVISTDAEGQVTFLNGVAGLLIGWTPADAIGRPVADVFSLLDERTRQPLTNPALVAMRDGVVAGPSGQTTLVASDGAERPVEYSAAPMRDHAGGIIGSVLVLRDVTEQVRAQEVQAWLAAIVQSSQDAVIGKSLDGTILSWNGAAERLFGYTSAEAIGRPIALIIPREHAAEERENMARIRRGQPVEQLESRRLSSGGRVIDVALTISPVHDATGRVIGASTVARDIGEQKRHEEALREAARRKDEFLALLAHELRNPLAPLRTALQVMRLGQDPAAVGHARAVMERQLGHMVRLVDDLLDVSRVSRNQIELRPARMGLAEALSSAVETAQPGITAARHTLVVTPPVTDVELVGDLTRLSQVFSNLLTNAAKYTPAGGRIWLETTVGDGEVIVAVRDTGIGMAPESLPTVFEMFSQVDRSMERTTGGLGIGLALAKGLVLMHGGTIAAESPGLGKGSTFTVRLPLPADQERSLGAATPVAAAEPVEHRSRRVLIAVDYRDSATSMAVLLELQGDEVRTVHSGLEAVATAETFRPDVILMDVGMPGLNGYDATRRIREQPWGRDIVIVAVTGWGQTTDKALAREAGCNAHLVKPVDLLALDRVLADEGR
jgi:PAS domain S-box-containing protein